MNLKNVIWMGQSLWGFLFGLGTAIMGYFLPVRNVVYVVVAAIVFDMILGLWVALKNGHGWQSIKMWRTVEKLFLAVLIVLMLYVMDTEIGIEYVPLHRIIAWLITGFEIWSMIESASKISDNKIFKILGKFLSSKIEDQTGVDINKKEK